MVAIGQQPTLANLEHTQRQRDCAVRASNLGLLCVLAAPKTSYSVGGCLATFAA